MTLYILRKKRNYNKSYYLHTTCILRKTKPNFTSNRFYVKFVFFHYVFMKIFDKGKQKVLGLFGIPKRTLNFYNIYYFLFQSKIANMVYSDMTLQFYILHKCNELNFF
jgi:hypothetical protein